MSWNQQQTRHLVGSLFFGSDPEKVQKPYRTTLENVKAILNTVQSKQQELNKIIKLFPKKKPFKQDSTNKYYRIFISVL
jgi:hypothetical protein